MKVNYYQDAALPEDRVDIYYRKQDEEITGLMEYLEAERVIVGRKDQTVKRIFLREIYYLEIVDRHCFAYLDREVFQIEYSLKMFLEKYAAFVFRSLCSRCACLLLRAGSGSEKGGSVVTTDEGG